MKRMPIFCATFLLGAAAAWAQALPAPRPPAWTAYNRGVRWEKSLDDAKARAGKEGKPILLYQLVGDLDKEGC